MKMDPSFVSTSFLFPKWSEILLQDYADEVYESQSWAIKLLKKESRKAVFNMCYFMGVKSNGVPGQACRLLERYISNELRQYTTSPAAADVHICTLHLTEQQNWARFKRTLVSKIPLRTASCIQLAAKMDSARVVVSCSCVRMSLLRKGLNYSAKEITDSEFQVFRSLGFRVPLWTSLDITKLLAVNVGLPTHADWTKGLEMVVTLCEYHRDQLNARVVEIGKTTHKTSMVRTLHMAAGAVLACSRYMRYKGPDPLASLASATLAPQSYVKCICDVILSDVIATISDDEDDDDQDDDDDADVGPQPPKKIRI